MLTKDVRFEGFRTSDWSRLLSVLRPVSRSIPPLEDRRGGVLVLHDGGRLRKLLHTKRGRLDLTDHVWPMPLPELAQQTKSSWVIAAEPYALEELSERFGSRARREDDIIAQLLSLNGIYRELQSENRLEVWPERLEKWMFPAPTVLSRALDAICADGHVILLGFFEHGELWTSIALRREGTGFSDIVGPDELREEMGLLAGDFRRDYRHLVRAVEDLIGPLALGCFTDVSTLRALELDSSPGAWAKAVMVRDVILAPSPAALAIPLMIDAVRAVMVTLRGLVGRTGMR